MIQLEFDFVSGLESKNEFNRNKQDREQQEFERKNLLRFYEIMAHYRIPKITVDEIRTLCKWS